MLTPYYIYAHTKPNGDVFYIGKGVKKRAWQKTGRNPHWHNVVNKYDIKVLLLADKLTKENANKEEIEVIKHFKKYGCLVNKTDGGDGGFNRPCTRNLSSWDWMRGDKHPAKRPEIRAKITASKKAMPKEFYEYMRGANNPTAKPVKCVETGIKFNTITEAINWLKCIGKVKAATTAISKVCDKTSHAKTAYGYHWEYIC